MLENLLETLGDHEDLGDPFVSIESFRFDGEGAAMELRIRCCDMHQHWSRWCITAAGLRDHRIASPWGDISIFEENHVLARQHTDAWTTLYFRGAPRSAEETVGRLLITHRGLVEEWIPIERFLNKSILTDFPGPLGYGSGEVADGPVFLLDAYARVLVEEGMQANALALRPARWWNGEQWVEQFHPLASLIVGKSYMVAEHFSAEKLAGGVG